MRRIASAGLAALVLVVVTTTSVRAQDAPTTPDGGLELADQTAIVSAGQAFTIAFEADGLPSDATLTATLYDRVRSRSELARAIVGSGLRSSRTTIRLPLAAIPRRPDGVLEWTLGTDGAAGAFSLGPPGVYPITLSADGADGDEVRLVSQLVVPPPNDGTAPPLGVSLIADIAMPPVVGTQGPAVDDEAVRDLGGLVSALGTSAGFPVTLRINPETIVALALSQDAAALSTLQELRALTADHGLLAAPYVPVAPDTLAAAGLGAELDRQMALGAIALGLVSDSPPTPGTWIAPRGLARAGLALLTGAGVHRVVLAADQVETSTDRVLTLARPFRLVPQPEKGIDDRGINTQALLLDKAVAERLRSDSAPAAIGVQVIAELAALWFEQPTVARSAVFRVDRSTPTEALVAIEDALAGSPFLRPVDLDTAFDSAAPLQDGRKQIRAIELAADTEAPRLNQATIDGIRSIREQLASLGGLVDDDDQVLQAVDADVFKAEADGAKADDRRTHLADARARIGAIVGGVSTAGTSTVTLTARKGSLPLTFVNGTGSPLSVVLHIRSAKIDVPGGRDVPLDLPVGATRVNIDIETRASGSIPLEVAVTSPDGNLLLTTARYSVQSTAVSGVGIVLSASALLFLAVWWGRHWREHRRSKKLVSPEDGVAT